MPLSTRIFDLMYASGETLGLPRLSIKDLGKTFAPGYRSGKMASNKFNLLILRFAFDFDVCWELINHVQLLPDIIDFSVSSFSLLVMLLMSSPLDSA